MDRDEELRRRRGEHTRSYSQDKPIGSGDNAKSIVRGVKQWLPDIPGAVGDLADMLYAGGANVLQGQKRRSIAPLGAGPAIRRAIAKKSPLEQVEVRATPETDWVEEGARFANPAMFMSPKNIATMGGLALASGVPGASMAIVKPRGGNWFTGSGSELELGMEWFAQGHNTPMFGAERAKALREWLGGPLMRYIKRDLATENDPVRKLLELDPPVSHVNPEAFLERAGYGPLAARAAKSRKAAKMPVEGVGTSPLSRAWETIADASIKNKKAGKIKPEDYPAGDPMAQDWVAKLPKNTPIYDDHSAGRIPSDLKLYHLRDELWNAVRQDSDLPNHLKLRPEDFQQMGIEKAIRHVANINDWRAAQKTEAAQEMLSGPGVKLIREYPENNPKGLRWVELMDDPDTYPDMDEESARAALQKQLKYEGDAMGHCVGGYCDEVLQGDSRIFSLRDAKGEPHVTIEARSDRRTPANWMEFATRSMREEDLQPIRDSLKGLSYEEQKLGMQTAIAKRPDFQKWLEDSGSSYMLTQARGKQNLPSKEEYLPFVQDFVRSSPLGKWGGFDEDPKYLGLSYEELRELLKSPGYAHGGLVGRQEFNGAVGYILD